jgi:hypothetical protein
MAQELIIQVYDNIASGALPIEIIETEISESPIFIEVQEDYAPVQSVNGKIGWVVIDKNDVGLSNVENVSILGASGYLDNKITNLSNDVVYTTGYQEISGYKYFSDGLDSNYLAVFPYGSDNSAIISLFNNSGGAVDLSLDNFTDEFSIKLPGRNGTLLTDQDNRILFTSGVQIISGLKIVSGQYPPSDEYSIDDIRESGAYFFIDDAERFQYHIIAPASQNNYVKFGPYSLGKLHKDTADLFFTTNGLVNTTNSLSNEISGVSGELQTQINSISGDYYSNSNPSGFITGVDLSAYVTKSNGAFTNRPTVNGTGVLLSGEAAGLPTTIVYTTGNQTISGIKNFVTRPQVNNIGIVISGESYPSNNPSGFITGVDLSAYPTIQQLNDLAPDEGGIIVSYAGGLWDPVSENIGFSALDGDLIIYRNGSQIAGITPQDLTSNRTYVLPNSGGTIALIGNVNATGSALNQKIDNVSGNLQNKINSLSGSAVLLYGNQTIDGTKTFRNSVYIHDLYVTGTEFIANVENNFIESPYILLNLTGGAVDGGIFFVTGTGLTGVNDYGPIIGFDHTDKFKFGIARRSDDLSTLDSIAGISDITDYSGFANNNFYLKSNPSGFVTNTNLQELQISLSTGIENYTGTFVTPFPSVPSVVATMLATQGFNYMTALTSVTTTNFVADFSDVIEETGVTLNIIAYN